MSLRYAVLSLVALCVIVVLVFKNYETWTRSVETPSEPSTVRKQEAKVESPPIVRPQKPAGMTPPDSTTIAAKNIFSPDRKDFPVQQSVETKKTVRPQIILYGTTIGDGYQFASVTNPGRSLLRGERETMSLKVGDKVGDYKLAKVLPDRIVMEGAEDSFEVLLHDAKTPKKRTDIRTDSKPATVTSTSPTAPAPETPKTTPPVAAMPGQPTAPPAVTTRPIPGSTAPIPTPRPYFPGRRRMTVPGSGTPPAMPMPPPMPSPPPEPEEN